ncbi:UDP-glucuronosyltransferase 1-6-like [Neoarius graeffei]|uniref:UDP-glucuronosyltransferase 1-6-like n=1 Tax=Neoarius graeffei TaxID=443677 RepID=UPI00298D506C|nr:UDP-glucuronosyltransferase 1-6-like [Neoarius graeffei]
MNGQIIQKCGLVLLTLLVSSVYTENILVFPVDGSHWINMKILIEALHDKGHNITVVRASDSWYIEETSQFYTSVTLGNSAIFEQEFIWDAVKRFLEIMREGSMWARLKLMKEMRDNVVQMVEKERRMVISMIEDQEVMQSLRDTKYDLLITDPALMSGVIVGHYLKLPTVFNARFAIHHEDHFAIAPSPLSFVPLPMLELSDHMSFFERVLNVLMYIVTELQIKYFMGSSYNELRYQLFGPGVDVFELVQGAECIERSALQLFILGKYAETLQTPQRCANKIFRQCCLLD